MLLSIALDKVFVPPTEIYQRYEMRSQIVHGSDLQIATKSDYHFLRFVAGRTVTGILELLKDHHSIQRPSHLINFLESPDHLQKAVSWLDRSMPDHPVTKFARQRLEETVSQGCN